ncbi:MAG: energy transducer TonB [Saprospiraceae bacterium]|nr:energy transducer TonB [Saprospiraceae bacterium]
MKNAAIILLLCSMISTGFAQELRFEVRPTYSRPVNKYKLNEATTLVDINPGYPTAWVTDYVSTELTVTSNGKVIKATGINATLSTDQKNILVLADLGTDIVVDVNYQSKNSITGLKKPDQMHFSMSLIPEIEAEYQGGTQLMTQYLKENAIGKISELDAKKFEGTVIKFTVNEEGEIANARISAASEDEHIDLLLLDAISNMPKWRPAANSNGTKVKQDFVFSVGLPGLRGC